MLTKFIVVSFTTHVHPVIHYTVHLKLYSAVPHISITPEKKSRVINMLEK